MKRMRIINLNILLMATTNDNLNGALPFNNDPESNSATPQNPAVRPGGGPAFPRADGPAPSGFQAPRTPDFMQPPGRQTFAGDPSASPDWPRGSFPEPQPSWQNPGRFDAQQGYNDWVQAERAMAQHPPQIELLSQKAGGGDSQDASSEPRTMSNPQAQQSPAPQNPQAATGATAPVSTGNSASPAGGSPPAHSASGGTVPPAPFPPGENPPATKPGFDLNNILAPRDWSQYLGGQRNNPFGSRGNPLDFLGNQHPAAPASTPKPAAPPAPAAPPPAPASKQLNGYDEFSAAELAQLNQPDATGLHKPLDQQISINGTALRANAKQAQALNVAPNSVVRYQVDGNNEMRRATADDVAKWPYKEDPIGVGEWVIVQDGQYSDRHVSASEGFKKAFVEAGLPDWPKPVGKDPYGREQFEKFMPFILKWEGGYDNDPDDPGGETKYGIDKRSHPGVDIKHLTKEQAIEIYWNEWKAQKMQQYPPEYRAAIFNTRVNGGPKTSTIMQNVGSPDEYVDRQEQFYRNLVKQRPKSQKYLNGWMNRTEDLRNYLHQQGNASPGAPPQPQGQ